ncbi:MAG: hypothetical protein AAF687_11750 [Pseudomonadota bacterium]
MKFNAILLAGAAPAMLLVACNSAETESAEEETATTETEAEDGATEDAEGASETTEETAEDKDAEEKEAEEEAPKQAAFDAGTYPCEDQGDTEVKFVKDADGGARLIYKSASEQAADQPPITTELEATGASAGYEDKFGRMSDAQGTATVWYRNDGRIEVTEGEGEYRNTYYCSK